jgi:hypothetical protein
MTTKVAMALQHLQHWLHFSDLISFLTAFSFSALAFLPPHYSSNILGPGNSALSVPLLRMLFPEK